MDHRGDRPDLRAARFAKDPVGRESGLEIFTWLSGCQQASRDAGRGVGQGMECRGDQGELDAARFAWRDHRQAENWGRRLTW